MWVGEMDISAEIGNEINDEITDETRTSLILDEHLNIIIV